MGIQTIAQADTELQLWYSARSAVTAGKSFSLTTSGGTRMLTYENLKLINDTIAMLERKVSGAEATGDKQGKHNFALANMGDNKANP